MPTTITNGDTISSPTLSLIYETERRSPNVVHTIIGRAAPDITLHPAGLRTGMHEFLFLTHSPAVACAQLHARAGVFTLDDTDVPLASMRYVVAGTIRTALDRDTLTRWIVTVEFQEVA